MLPLSNTVENNKRKIDIEAPSAKRAYSVPIQASVIYRGHEARVAFEYCGKTAEIALTTLKQSSVFFDSFFSRWCSEQVGTNKETSRTISLQRPDSKDYSPLIFLQMIQGENQLWSSADWLKVAHLMTYYQIKGPLSMQILNSIDIDNIDALLDIYPALEQVVDNPRALALHCLQVLVDDNLFFQDCLLKPQLRQFFSERICKRIDFFNRMQRRYVTRIDLHDFKRPFGLGNQETLWITYGDYRQLENIGNLLKSLESITVSSIHHPANNWTNYLWNYTEVPGSVLCALFKDDKDQQQESERVFTQACASLFFKYGNTIQSMDISLGEGTNEFVRHSLKYIVNEKGQFIFEFTTNPEQSYLYSMLPQIELLPAFSQAARITIETNGDNDDERAKAIFLEAAPFSRPSLFNTLSPSQLPWNSQGKIDSNWTFSTPLQQDFIVEDQ
jgi:hypothetical protein